jgi:anti-sigma factor RsiW
MTVDQMSCKELVELVTEYLEATLPAEDRARFEAHLAACPGCLDYVAQFRTTIRLTGKLSVAGVPVDTRRHLLRAFRDLSQC